MHCLPNSTSLPNFSSCIVGYYSLIAILYQTRAFVLGPIQCSQAPFEISTAVIGGIMHEYTQDKFASCTLSSPAMHCLVSLSIFLSLSQKSRF